MFHLIQPERPSNFLVRCGNLVETWLGMRLGVGRESVQDWYLNGATNRLEYQSHSKARGAGLPVPFIGLKVAVKYVLVANCPPGDNIGINQG
jgi:hypothetical protein